MFKTIGDYHQKAFETRDELRCEKCHAMDGQMQGRYFRTVIIESNLTVEHDSN